MQTKSNRQVRLQGKLRPRIRERSGYKRVPWLSLSGVWLQQAGFQAGDRVEIMVTNKELVIKNAAAHGDQSH